MPAVLLMGMHLSWHPFSGSLTLIRVFAKSMQWLHLHMHLLLMSNGRCSADSITRARPLMFMETMAAQTVHMCFSSKCMAA